MQKNECQTLKGLGKVKLLENYDAVKRRSVCSSCECKKEIQVFWKEEFINRLEIWSWEFICGVDESEGQNLHHNGRPYLFDKWGLSEKLWWSVHCQTQ